VNLHSFNWSQLLLALLLLLIFIVAAAMNARAAIFSRKGKNISLVPFIGGTAGTISFLIMPFSMFRRFWWVPLVLDWGCIPGLAQAGWYWFWIWKRNAEARRRLK